MTWERIVAAFLLSRRERQAAPKTLTGYRTYLANFAAWCTSHHPERPGDPTQVTPLDLATYRSWLMDNKKPRTVNGALSTLRTLFAWATEVGLLSSNPARYLRRVPEVMLGPQALGREELARLLAAASRRNCRDAVLIILLAHTGLRISEALDLTWADIRLRGESGVVVVQRGKGMKYREVPLNATAGRALGLWRDLWALGADGVRLDAPVFPGPSGKALTKQTAATALARCSQLAGIDPPATPLRLRHTFCKALVDAGESLDRVAALAGHVHISTTARYTRPTPADLQRAVGKLDPGG